MVIMYTLVADLLREFSLPSKCVFRRMWVELIENKECVNRRSIIIMSTRFGSHKVNIRVKEKLKKKFNKFNYFNILISGKEKVTLIKIKMTLVIKRIYWQTKSFQYILKCSLWSGVSYGFWNMYIKWSGSKEGPGSLTEVMDKIVKA